jgi:hypothetical protein
MTYSESLNSTLILNGIGFSARLLPNLFPRYAGTMNVFIAFLFASLDSGSIYAWTVHMDHFLQIICRWCLASLPRCCTRYQLRYVEDRSTTGHHLRGCWDWRIT